MILRTTIAAVLIFLAAPVYAQDDFHIIPQVADGFFPDGTSYRTQFMILPWFESTAADCTLRLYGLTATISSDTGQTINSTNAVALTMPAGTFFVLSTSGNQPFRSGYATLTCSNYVFAQALYSFYGPGGAKLSEATVFSTEGEFNPSFRLVLDQRGGARLGLSIANNTDITRTYRLTFGATTATVQVPGRTALARFVDEVMTLPFGAVGILKVTSTDFSSFGAIGLRFTGAAFTTIPAN